MKNVLLTLSLLATSQSFAGTITIQLGEKAYLPSCGGTIELKKVNDANGNQRARMELNHVQNCSKVDMLYANGDYSPEYRERTIDSDGNPYDRSSKFLVPKDMMELGRNSFTILVYSPNGRVSDTVRVKFTVVQTPVYPTYPTQPVYPSYPSQPNLTLIEKFKVGIYVNCSIKTVSSGYNVYNQLYVNNYYGSPVFQGNFLAGYDDQRLTATLISLTNNHSCTKQRY